MSDLEDYRKELDAIDQELVSLFEKRLAVSKKIGNYKKNQSLPIYDKERERQVLLQNIRQITDKDSEVQVRHFLETVMDLSKEVQKDVRASDRRLRPAVRQPSAEERSENRLFRGNGFLL